MELRILPSVVLASLLAIGTVYGQQSRNSDTSIEPTTPEAIKQFNDGQVAEASKQVVGKEDQPSEAVFKNIKILKGVPAGHLLGIMQIGFSKSLGTSCAHCHVPGQWEKDDKPAKPIARDMWKMMHTINGDLLKTIDGLKDRTPIVNCTTCHRGHLKPALDLEADETKK